MHGYLPSSQPAYFAKIPRCGLSEIRRRMLLSESATSLWHRMDRTARGFDQSLASGLQGKRIRSLVMQFHGGDSTVAHSCGVVSFAAHKLRPQGCCRQCLLVPASSYGSVSGLFSDCSIPDDELDLDWFNRSRNLSNSGPAGFDQSQTWQPKKMHLDDDCILNLDYT